MVTVRLKDKKLYDFLSEVLNIYRNNGTKESVIKGMEVDLLQYLTKQECRLTLLSDEELKDLIKYKAVKAYSKNITKNEGGSIFKNGERGFKIYI